MEAGMGLLQIGNGQLQVPFRGGQRAVAQQVLHVAQVGVVLNQMRGARVPPYMGCDVLLDLGQPGMTFHQVAHGMGINGLPTVRQEQPVTLWRWPSSWERMPLR